MKKHLSTIILILIFLVGLSVLLYPSISNYINTLNSTKAIMNYDESLKDLSEAEYDEIINAAEDYNDRLYKTSGSFYNPDKVDGYWETLDINGSGIMGYITIEKIDVMLPIYHGTSTEVLNTGAGHIQGTSLPVGGENTHVVLSAHRGLPSAKLFTNLDELEEGDIFTLTILNSLLTYQVTSVEIVEPNDVDSLLIQDGKDMCTLVTCTPYGINTHRLLVHAERVKDNDVKVIVVTASGHVIDPMYVAPIVAAPILVILLIWLIVHYRRRKNKKSNLKSDL